MTTRLVFLALLTLSSPTELLQGRLSPPVLKAP